MDLFTPPTKKRKRQAPESPSPRRTKKSHTQIGSSAATKSNIGPNRETRNATRRTQENASASSSKQHSLLEDASPPLSRQSLRVSRPALKTATPSRIILSSDDESDCSLPRRILIARKTPPRKRKHDSSISGPTKIQQALCLEISDSDDDQVNASSRVKRAKISKNALSADDIINLCSSSDEEDPTLPSSPLASHHHRIMPEGERDSVVKEVSNTQQATPPPSHRPTRVPLPTRINVGRFLRNTKSGLSGRKCIRPKRDIVFFDGDAQPKVEFLTDRLFKKCISSVKAKIEVQKRKKKKAAAAVAAHAHAIAFKATAQTSDITLNMSESSLSPRKEVTSPGILSLSQANVPTRPKISQTDVGTEATNQTSVTYMAITPSVVPQRQVTPPRSFSEAEGTAQTSLDITQPGSTLADVSDGEVKLTVIPNFEDIIASAKRVKTVFQALKTEKKLGAHFRPTVGSGSNRSSTPMPDHGRIGNSKKRSQSPFVPSPEESVVPSKTPATLLARFPPTTSRANCAQRNQHKLDAENDMEIDVPAQRLSSVSITLSNSLSSNISNITHKGAVTSEDTAGDIKLELTALHLDLLSASHNIADDDNDDDDIPLSELELLYPEDLA